MDFAEAFDKDLAAKGWEQSEVCLMLSEGEPAPISSAAISNWKKRNNVPPGRLARLIELFGEDSNCARYREQEAIPRVSSRPFRGSLQRLNAAIAAGEVHMAPAGTARVVRYTAEQPATLLVRQFEALLLKLPEANRVAAAQAAYQAMIPYLLDPASDQPELPGLE